MTPHSISTADLSNRLTPAQKAAKFAALGPIAARHGQFPKGTVLPETMCEAIDPADGKRKCPRVKVADLPEGHLKQKWIDQQEQNQQIASCCRHPENHEIEGLKSHPQEPTVDIYIFHCTCGKGHIKFCCGATDKRPEWKAD